jgi:hypothetical protein
MPTFAHSDALYACLRPMFARISAEAPAAYDGLLKSRLQVKFKVTAPAAEVVIDGRQRPVMVTYGPSAGRPDLEAALSAETLHQILLDALSIKKAMASGHIRVRGPAWKLSVVIDVIKAGRRFYPEIFKGQPVA